MGNILSQYKLWMCDEALAENLTKIEKSDDRLINALEEEFLF